MVGKRAGGAKPQIHEHWLRGDAAEAIVGFAADHRADLVVLGAKGAGAFKTALTGSVVTKVVARSPVPTIVVNAKDVGA